MDYPDDYAVDRSEWINYTVATTLVRTYTQALENVAIAFRTFALFSAASFAFPRLPRACFEA